MRLKSVHIFNGALLNTVTLTIITLQFMMIESKILLMGSTYMKYNSKKIGIESRPLFDYKRLQSNSGLDSIPIFLLLYFMYVEPMRRILLSIIINCKVIIVNVTVFKSAPLKIWTDFSLILGNFQKCNFRTESKKLSCYNM